MEAEQIRATVLTFKVTQHDWYWCFSTWRFPVSFPM